MQVKSPYRGPLEELPPMSRCHWANRPLWSLLSFDCTNFVCLDLETETKKRVLAGLESTWMTRPAWQSSLHPFYSILNSLIPRIKLTYASIGLKNCHIQLNKITIRSSTERWMGRENKLTDIGVIYSHLLQNLPLSKKPSKSSFTTGASQNHIIASHE